MSRQCPRCGTPLQVAVVNNRKVLICPKCTNNHNSLLEMLKCDNCKKWYCKAVDNVCDCKKIKSV